MATPRRPFTALPNGFIEAAIARLVETGASHREAREAAYLLAVVALHPSRRVLPGVLALGPAGIAETTAAGFSTEQVRQHITRLTTAQLLEADLGSRPPMLLVPSVIHCGAPRTENAVKAAANDFNLLPQSKLRARVAEEIESAIGGNQWFRLWLSLTGLSAGNGPEAHPESGVESGSGSEVEPEPEPVPASAPEPRPLSNNNTTSTSNHQHEQSRKTVSTYAPGRQTGRIFLHRWQLEELITALGVHASTFELDAWVESLTAKADASGLTFPDRDSRWAWVQAELKGEIVRRGLPVADGKAIAVPTRPKGCAHQPPCANDVAHSKRHMAEIRGDESRHQPFACTTHEPRCQNLLEHARRIAAASPADGGQA